MRGTFFIFRVGPPRPGRADLSRFAGPTYVGKSVVRQLASPDGSPTKVDYLLIPALPDYLLSVREIVPTQSSSYYTISKW